MLDLKNLLKNQYILTEGDYVFLATFGVKYQDLALSCAKKYPSAVMRNYAVEITECNPKDRTVKKWKKIEGKSVWIKVE